MQAFNGATSSFTICACIIGIWEQLEPPSQVFTNLSWLGLLAITGQRVSHTVSSTYRHHTMQAFHGAMSSFRNFTVSHWCIRAACLTVSLQVLMCGGTLVFLLLHAVLFRIVHAPPSP